MATAEFFRGEDSTTKEKWYVSKLNTAVRCSIGKRGDGYRVEDRMRGEYAITATAQEARELARWLAGHEDHGNYEADPTTFYEWWGFDGEKKRWNHNFFHLCRGDTKWSRGDGVWERGVYLYVEPRRRRSPCAASDGG